MLSSSVLFLALSVSAAAPTAVFLIGEDEYETEKTLPEFATLRLITSGIHCQFVHANPDPAQGFPGIEKLAEADLLILSVRRRSLPAKQMEQLKEYVASGKPIVALRTTSHGFALRDGKPPAGHAVWPEFDREVLGCRYNNHHGNKGPDDPQTFLWINGDRRRNRILRDVGWKAGLEVQVTSWLYKSEDLASDTEVFVWGRVEGREPKEPVAWTRTKDRRMFYTSLGHPDDFKLPAFQQLLKNAIDWSLDN